MTIEELIQAGILIISKGSNKLIDRTRFSEDFVYEALMELFKNTDITNGKLNSSPKAEEFLSTLEQRVFLALAKSGYGQAVNDFTTNFDLISDNVIDLQMKLKNGILSRADVNKVKRIEVNKTIANLTEQGLYNDFIAPVREGLYRNLMFGATVDETEELIRSYVKSKKDNDSRLLRYVGQVSADSLHQFDGSANQTAKLSLGLNGTQYVGSIIKDSRGQCRKWVDMKIIPDAILEEEISFALNPKNSYGGHKCSGMIPGTNAKTFCTLRGGRRCRHRAIGVRMVKMKK